MLETSARIVLRGKYRASIGKGYGLDGIWKEENVTKLRGSEGDGETS